MFIDVRSLTIVYEFEKNELEKTAKISRLLEERLGVPGKMANRRKTVQSNKDAKGSTLHLFRQPKSN
jgi:hypothetical protein